jgi:hypothetical protein
MQYTRVAKASSVRHHEAKRKSVHVIANVILAADTHTSMYLSIHTSNFICIYTYTYLYPVSGQMLLNYERILPIM